MTRAVSPSSPRRPRRPQSPRSSSSIARDRRETASRSWVGLVTRWSSSITSRGSSDRCCGGGRRDCRPRRGVECFRHEPRLPPHGTPMRPGRNANEPPEGGSFEDVPAATYSPTKSPWQYHRRWRASLPGSGWDRVFPLRYGHRNGGSRRSPRIHETMSEGASLEQSSGTAIASASKSQALGLLVPVSSTRCRASTSGLSTWWSSRGLTRLTRWEISSRGRLRT